MEKVVLTAEEAMKVTIDNRMGFDDCMLEISNQAKNGLAFALFFKQIKQETLDKLMDMGYQLGTFTDPMGQKFFKITWNN